MFNAINLAKLTADDLAQIRLGMQYVYNFLDIASMGDTPKIVAFDLPGAGAEIALNYVEGKFEVNWGASG